MQQIMSAADIELAVQRIALQILEKNAGRGQLAVVGIHTCGVPLAKRIHGVISAKLGTELPFGSLDINLYRDDWSLISQNPVVRTSKIAFGVDGRNLILVDDVIYSGRTIRAAMDAIMDYGRPKTIQLAVLVDRGGRELPIQPDYVGQLAQIRDKERITVRLDESGEAGEVIVES